MTRTEPRAEVSRVRNQPLTVGRLRELLSEFHESDTVLVGDEGDLLYRVSVNRQESIRGKVVVIEAGERYCVRRRAESKTDAPDADAKASTYLTDATKNLREAEAQLRHEGNQIAAGVCARLADRCEQEAHEHA